MKCQSCEKDAIAKGLCKSHYMHKRNADDPSVRERRDKYKLNNHQAILEKGRLYSQTLRSKFTRLRAFAKFSNFVITLTFEEFCCLVSQPCHYCGGNLPTTGYGLDRKDS
jgi:hypothetical protein